MSDATDKTRSAPDFRSYRRAQQATTFTTGCAALLALAATVLRTGSYASPDTMGVLVGGSITLAMLAVVGALTTHHRRPAARRARARPGPVADEPTE